MPDKTKVIFRHWKGDVIAIFPEIPGDMSPYTCMSYQHVGQHGACDPYGIIADSRPATLIERWPLRKELMCLGYKLQVIHRNRFVFLRARQYALGIR